MVVVSQAFDVSEQMKAMGSGVFDYVGWPPYRSEIEWALLNAFHERNRLHNLLAEQAC